MTLPWFRLYHRMIDDEKLRLLAFEDRWHFVALCCLKADGLLDEPQGDLWQRKVAVKLGVQVRELEEIGRRLREVGLVDEGLKPLAWDNLQYESDSAAKRMRDYRKRKKKQADAKPQGNCDVTVTLQDTDKDTEELPKGNLSPNDDPNDFTFDDFEESWAEVAKEFGLPQMRAGARDRRKRLFATRKRQYPDIADWRAAFATLRKAKWMHGDNRQNWRCDADDFLDPRKFNRLVEGKYGEAN